MLKAPLVKDFEIRRKLYRLRHFNNKLPGRNVNQNNNSHNDDNDNNIIKNLLYMNHNNNNNNNANFSYDNLPDIPTLDPPDMIARNEDPILKNIDSVLDSQTKETKKNRINSKSKCCIFKNLRIIFG